MNGRATLDNLELKYQKTCGNTMGQLLDYARGVSQLTMEDVVKLAAEGESPIDLRAAFEKRFGRPLPEQLGGRSRTTLIASVFDRRTLNGIEYLQQQRVPIRALQYAERGESILLIPFTREDLERQEQRARLAAQASSPRAKNSWCRTTTYKIHDDFFDFWALHSCQFVWDFLPSSFVFALYEDWRRTEALRGWPRERFGGGHFGRQLKQLVVETGGWDHHPRFRTACLLDAHEPLDDGLTWAKPTADQPVAGYLRAGSGRADE
jgi:hypothetical protein